MWSKGNEREWENFCISYHTRLYQNFCPSNITCSQDLKGKTNASEPQPFHLAHKTCTLMFMPNLASPEWITVLCEEPLLTKLICVTEEKQVPKENMSLHITANNNCPKNFILKGSICFIFTHFGGNINIPNSVKEDPCSKQFKGGLKPYTVFPSLEFIFRATSSEFQPLLSVKLETQICSEPTNSKMPSGEFLPSVIYSHTYERFFTNFKWTIDQHSVEEAQGLFVCQMHQSRHSVVIYFENIFKCEKFEYVSAHLLCDGTKDCTNGKDETNRRCIVGIPGRKCPMLFFYSLSSDCHRFHRPSIHGTKSNATQVKPALYEPQSVNHTCRHPSEIPCKDKEDICFKLTDICVFRVDKHSKLIPCRTGVHLEDCKLFECSRKFKCPDHYCMPWIHVCDGRWDCPSGSDEHICRNTTVCTNQFKCTGSERSVCISLDDVCDVKPDCPQSDDELLCDLSSVRCPSECLCLLYAISCFAEANIGNSLLPVLAAHFSNISITSIECYLQALPHVSLVNFSYNDISSICKETDLLKSTGKLEVQGNKLTHLHQKCFCSLSTLAVIFLQNNLITTVSTLAFFNLSGLQILDLSHNRIEILCGNTMQKVPRLAILLVKENPLTAIKSDFFDNFIPTMFLTNSYYLCCIVSKSGKCIETKTKLELKSCHMLIHNMFQVVLLAIVGFLVILMNVASFIIHRFSSEKTAGSYNLSVCFVNMSFFLYSFHLFILFIAHFVYHKHFIGYEIQWRSSPACFSAFAMALAFHLMSPTCVVFLAFSRMIVVVLPFCVSIKRFSLTLTILSVISFSVVVVVTLVCVLVKVLFGVLPCKICSPVENTQQNNTSDIVFLWISSFVGFYQICISVVICVFHIILGYTLKNSEPPSSPANKKTSKSLWVHLIVVAVSFLLSTAASNGSFLFLGGSSQCSQGLFLWIAILLVPLPCVVHPFMFIISHLRKKKMDEAKQTPRKQQIKVFYQCG